MAEQIFFDNGTVKVTNARFMVGAQTYAMNGVTSVRSLVEPAKRGIWIGLVILGLLVLGSSVTLGGLMIAIGALALFLIKNRHTVLLHSSSGESRALTDTDASLIDQVVTALNNAIIHRG